MSKHTIFRTSLALDQRLQIVTRFDIERNCVVVVVVVVVVSDATMREQCLCQQSPVNCAREPSMTKHSSPSRAPKTRAPLQDNPEEREKCGESAKSPFFAVTLAESVSGTNTEPLSLQGHRDVHTLSMNCNSRDIDHLTLSEEWNCGTTVFCTV